MSSCPWSWHQKEGLSTAARGGRVQDAAQRQMRPRLAGLRRGQLQLRYSDKNCRFRYSTATVHGAGAGEALPKGPLHLALQLDRRHASKRGSMATQGLTLPLNGERRGDLQRRRASPEGRRRELDSREIEKPTRRGGSGNDLGRKN